MDSLPIEILYETMDFLDPFDIINFSKALVVTYPSKYKSKIEREIFNFCNGNTQFINIICKIISDFGIVNYNIFNILKKIVYIVSKGSKYMDILGFTTYTFYLHIGPTFIAQDSVPIIYMDTKIINIYYPNVFLLKYYLEKYMNFKSHYILIDKYAFAKDEYIYKIKRYNLKHFLKN